MKYTLLLCLCCLLLLANTCKKKSKIEKELLGVTWLHSFEEDEGDTVVYRPNSYDFPPSRGRTGFSIEQGGVMKEYVIAPTDGLEEHTGSWEYGDKNVIVVRVNGNGIPPQLYKMKIISLEDNVLKVIKSTPGTSN